MLKIRGKEIETKLLISVLFSVALSPPKRVSAPNLVRTTDTISLRLKLATWRIEDESITNRRVSKIE